MRCFEGRPRLRRGEVGLKMNYGCHIKDAVKEAIMVADVFGAPAKFYFNGVYVTVGRGSNARAMLRDIWRAMHGYIDKHVGPYARRKLRHSDKLNDRRLRERYKRKNEKEKREREAEEALHRQRVEEKLALVPTIDVSDPARWQEMFADKQGCGLIIDYADAWGRLMQLEMANGKSLEEAAEATEHEADIFGMSGASSNMSLMLLVKYWKHGEELRQWHNVQYLGKKKGTEANAKPGTVVSTFLLGG